MDEQQTTGLSRLRRIPPGYLGLACRLVLAVIFFWSGIAKAKDPISTQTAVRAYGLLPGSLVDPVAYALPWVEIAVAALLLAGMATRLSACISVFLFLVFIVGVSSAGIRGISIDCGCFGGGGAVAPGQTHYTTEILRDVLFLLIAVFLVVRPWTRFSIDGLLLSQREPV